MLKIWGRRTASNVHKVSWCAEEAGVTDQSPFRSSVPGS